MSLSLITVADIASKLWKTIIFIGIVAINSFILLIFFANFGGFDGWIFTVFVVLN